MDVRVRRLVLVVAVALAGALLVGCGTFPASITRGGPRSSAPAFSNNQVVDITGRVSVDKNQISLADLNSPAVFRLVGLKPAEQKAIGGLAGKVTKLRLRVLSSPAPNNYNAQFIQFSPRS